MAQALVRFLSVQYTERDGTRQPFFGGMFGIFGHGNVAGVGQALDQMRRGLRYYQCRNEQAMVHTAAAYAKMHNRMRALACTTSIGPGATDMLTGAVLGRLGGVRWTDSPALARPHHRRSSSSKRVECRRSSAKFPGGWSRVRRCPARSPL
jgi:thiamine pyrophosphate-dependent enzyme